MTVVKKSVREALSRFPGQRPSPPSTVGCHYHNPAPHDFNRGHFTPQTVNLAQPTTSVVESQIVITSPDVTHEFIRGRTNPRRQSPATHEFIHGNQETNVKICTIPRFQSWKTKIIRESHTVGSLPIPAILVNEFTEYDYIMPANEFASTIIFHSFHTPTNEFVGYNIKRSFTSSINEFMVSEN